MNKYTLSLQDKETVRKAIDEKLEASENGKYDFSLLALSLETGLSKEIVELSAKELEAEKYIDTFPAGEDFLGIRYSLRQ